MKILITGATGFVGSHLAESLAKDGHDIYALVRNPKKAKEFNTPGVHIYGGLNSSKHCWIDDLPEDLDVVIHTAGLLHTYKNEEFFEVNTNYTKTLLSDLNEKYQQLNFIFISSQAAAGPGERDESDKEGPVSQYGKSKLAAEIFLKNNIPSDWSLKIIRPPMVIGPRDPAILDVFKMINKNHALITGLKGLKKEYSFINVYDLVDGIKKSIEHTENDTFFLAHPETVTFEKIICEIQSVLEKKRVIKVYIPTPVIKGVSGLMALTQKLFSHDLRLTPDKSKELMPEKWVCRPKKAEEKILFKCSRSFSSSIKETHEDYKSRGWI